MCSGMLKNFTGVAIMLSEPSAGSTRASRQSRAAAGHTGWDDDRLLSECLKGNEQAWEALIEKYKNLIYSIPIRYGMTREDAADLFQAVCLELYSALPTLRKAGSLRSWLITVAAHKAFHWKRQQRRRSGMEVEGTDQEELAQSVPASPETVEEWENAQMVRDAMADLPERCGEMIRLLFFEHPPVPYEELARRLGLATGSIGFIRGRCLKRLGKRLKEMGFR
jgi:RNA polymerase sigma factor (sigma-70 family)